MSVKDGKYQTFDQGAIQALELAICTLVRVLPEPSKRAFIAAYPQNVENWSDTALPSTAISDEWLTGLRETAAGLLRVAKS
ncbi:hypothetical protein [Acidovorax sp. FJL06]|uniref:hypothetical protein n=1 Tax=Acidovorax sp. FJL06 TaxID=2153365 RepID=UPI000F55F737|nr:hypothetical protein [Acidovorax sp. FJL06]